MQIKEKYENFTPVGNEIYISLEKETNDTITVNGQELFLDTAFERMWHARQWGEVRYFPRRYNKESEDGIQLVKGDKIYCHHFLIDNRQPQDVMGELLYFVNYEMCFCVVRDGEIHMLNQYILVTPILESEDKYMTKSGIMIKPEAENIERIGKVVKTNATSEDYGVRKGAVVTFLNDADYEMEIEGKKYWVMRNREIECELPNYEKEPFDIEVC